MLIQAKIMMAGDGDIAAGIAVKDTVSGSVLGGSGTTSISMPSNNSSDVVVAFFGQDNNNTDSIATLAGFTTIIDSNLTDRPLARSAYMVNPGATADLTNNSATRDLFYILRSYSGVNTASPLTGTAARTGSATGTPNPPSITPAVNGSMVVALGAIQNVTDTAYSAPSGYSNLTVKSAGDTSAQNAVGMIADFLQTTAAAENPAAFTHGSDSNHNSGITLALKPA